MLFFKACEQPFHVCTLTALMSVSKPLRNKTCDQVNDEYSIGHFKCVCVCVFLLHHEFKIHDVLHIILTYEGYIYRL